MTYNFDPDRWFDNERTVLEKKRADGELSEKQFEEALADLGRQYEAMLDWLDGSYRIPT